MTDYIISSKLSNETVYAYYRGRLWHWNGSIWKESRIMTHRFELARAADKNLTPQEFLTNGAEFAPLDEYEIDTTMLDALENAKPCKTAPIEPVEEHPAPVPAHTADVAAPCSSTPVAPAFDFSALGDLSEQAVETDRQFDLHYGTAQDEYLISCIYVAKMHALTAKAGRYGGGTWTKWYESKGLSEGSARTMTQNGDAFKSATVADLKLLPSISRKDLNLIARSGCAEQLTAAAGDSQRVQELLAQIKSKDAQLEAAHADISGLKDRATAAEAREEEAWSMVSKAQDEAQTAKNDLDAALADVQGLDEENARLKAEKEKAERSYNEMYESRIAANLQRQKAEAERDRAEARAKDAENQLVGSRQVAEAARLRGDKLKAENDALKKQPITAVVDKEEVERQAREMAAEMTADLRAQLEQASSGSEQDAHSSYDNVLLADRSFQNIGKMVVPSLRRLPPEQREQLTNMLIHTLGQIQGEVSRCL